MIEAEAIPKEKPQRTFHVGDYTVVSTGHFGRAQLIVTHRRGVPLKLPFTAHVHKSKSYYIDKCSNRFERRKGNQP